MSAHTPGPWSRVDTYAYGIHVFSPGGISRGFLVASTHSDVDVTRGEQEANAFLIASAPELLAALRTFATLPADTPPPGILPSAWRAAIDAAQAVIAKTEGR